MKLSGLLSGTLQYQGNDQGGAARGSLAVNRGKFNVLPWIGKLTAMVGMQDITDVEVDTETADFAWKDHALHLSNIDIRMNDVTRISGTVDVAASGQVDGRPSWAFHPRSPRSGRRCRRRSSPPSRTTQLDRCAPHRHVGSSAGRPDAAVARRRAQLGLRPIQPGHAKSVANLQQCLRKMKPRNLFWCHTFK